MPWAPQVTQPRLVMEHSFPLLGSQGRRGPVIPMETRGPADRPSWAPVGRARAAPREDLARSRRFPSGHQDAPICVSFHLAFPLIHTLLIQYFICGFSAFLIVLFKMFFEAITTN